MYTRSCIPGINQSVPSMEEMEIAKQASDPHTSDVDLAPVTAPISMLGSLMGQLKPRPSNIQAIKPSVPSLLKS